MRLNGRRESSNVDDRRRSGAGKAGLGIGGALLIAAITYFTTGNLGQAITTGFQVVQSSGSGGNSSYEPTAEENELATFTSQILAGTEDIWTEQFQKMGKTYHAPHLVMFHGSVNSGCGAASASTGPFYCSGDQTVYIDLQFFTTMKQQFGTAGDFAYAYVIAHEVGHHVQNELGILGQVHQKMSQVSKTESNQYSVRLELQADFLAGVWAYNDHKKFQSLEDGDIEEGLNIASRIGDDYLQKQAQGYTVPESFNHGTSAQRSRWLKKGATGADISEGNKLFQLAYSEL
ncbi:MAG: neutral zinc metallopeptidase [Paludibacteraceae bacterium]|nr:neutral zinc metallopeptidase [Paludibacteraceae bacterium]